MTDLNKQELRRLAEASAEIESWYELADFLAGRYTELELDVVNEADRSFIVSASPATILSLLDEIDQLRAEVGVLRKGVELLPLFTCTGKGGEYAKLGYAKPAGAIKAIQGDSGLIVYRDTKTGQLYFRDPRDFEQRMMALAIMEPSPLGGDEVRELTTLDISTGAGKSCGGLGCCQLCADEKAGEVGNG